MINTQVIKRKKPRNKLTEYDKFAKDAPKMPDYTCPAIDNVLEYTNYALIGLSVVLIIMAFLISSNVTKNSQVLS